MNSTPALAVGRVLVVEDESLVRELLLETFAADGHEVLAACDGRQALQVLAKETIDVVISDLVMPETDGLELLMEMRRSFSEVPLVAITAPTNHVYLAAAKRLGAACSFEKPLPLDQLSAAVQRLIQARRQAGPAESGPS